MKDQIHSNRNRRTRFPFEEIRLMSRRHLVAVACALLFLTGQHYRGCGLTTVAFGQGRNTSAEKENSRKLIIPENVEFEENVEYGRAGDRT